MSPWLFEKIIQDLDEVETIYTGQYNEIILYQYLSDMLDILRDYNKKTVILSNGIAFTADKLALLEQYQDVIEQIHFNCPSFKIDEWIVETDRNSTLFPLGHIKNTVEIFGDKVIIGMNALSEEIANNRAEYARTIISNGVIPVVNLCDRAGLLKDIIPNELPEGDVIGCNQANGRLNTWLHVNALGKAFTCCQDYFFKYEFGDFNTQTLSEMWGSEAHIEVINKTLLELCPKCMYAIRE